MGFALILPAAGQRRMALCLVVSCVFIVFLSRVEAGQPGLDLVSAERTALESAPFLDELRAKVSMFRDLSVAAGELPDPALLLSALNFPVDTFRVDQDGMTQLKVGLVQKFPYPGKLALKRELTVLEARGLGYELEDRRLSLLRDVRLAWFKWLYARKSLEVVEENVSLLKELLEIAKVQYQVGKGLQQDVLLARTELDNLYNEQVMFAAQEDMARDRLAELLNRDVRADNLVEAFVDLPDPPSEGTLLQKIEDHPVILKIKTSIARSEKIIALRQKEYFPDLGVGVNYGHRQTRDMQGEQLEDLVSLSFQVDLPVFTARRQDRRLAGAKKARLAQEKALQTARLRLGKMVRSGWTDLRSKADQVRRYEDLIIPESKQTIADIRVAYMTGRLDFLNLIRSQLRYYNFRKMLWKLKSGKEQAKARLWYLAQGGQLR